MEFGVLGPLSVVVGGRAAPIASARQRAVLALLLRSANQTVSISRLIDAVWGGHPAKSVHNMVHTYTWRLRVMLVEDGERRLSTEPAGYRLRVEPGELDRSAFEQAAGRGRDALRRGDAAAAAEQLRAALELWRGEPFADVVLHDDDHDAELQHLAEARAAALEDRIEADLLLGRHESLVGELRQLALLHPLRERAAAQLMLACYRSGRQADALDAFAHIRAELAEELGLDPGRELRELHHRILRADPELLAPREGGRIVPRQLPTSAGHFAGRSAELAELTALLDRIGRSGGTAVISAIDGTAGIGKTALALHWGHRNLGSFPDGQLHVNLRGFGPEARPVTPAEAVRGFLDALAVPADRIPLGLDAQAALYRSLLADRRMLVVLDNASDADQIRPLLPAGPTCLALVTSRNPLTGLITSEGAWPVTLNLPTADEAREMLAARLGARRVAAEDKSVSALIELCARLPLALSIAAARAAVDPELTLADLVAQLEDARGRLDALDVGDVATDPRAVFSWSYRRLSAPAARLFRLLGLHSGPDISAAAAASLAALPAPAADGLLGELVGARLLDEHAPGRYTFHDLLRAYAAERARADDDAQEQRSALRRVLDHYLRSAHVAAEHVSPIRVPLTLPEAAPGITVESFADAPAAHAWLEAEHRALMAVLGLADAEHFDEHACVLPSILSNYFNQRGYLNDCLTIQQYTLAAARRLEDLSWQARAHRFIGLTHTRLDAYDDAYAELRNALDLYERIDDADGEASTRFTIGALLHRRGEYRASLDHVRRSLTLFEAADNRPKQAEALNAIGWLYSQVEEYEQALVHCRRALYLQRELGDRFGEAHTGDSIGFIYHHLGRHAQALACYQEALSLYRTIGDGLSQATTLNHIGDVHLDTGQPHAAERAWRQALEILDELGHPDAQGVRTKLQRAADRRTAVTTDAMPG
ncbi:MAG TPA: BTAD domain-containing putative transcriptional regulator [Actinocrinis sp.]|nr:BTAD domain-containing putative transcriptional regulator [Actinocrinis sp.]